MARPRAPRRPVSEKDRRLKTFIYAILGFVVAGVAAVLVGPSFVNWSAYRDDIAAQLARTTGRNVVIRGDVRLDMLPRPALALSKVRVAGRTGTDLLRAESVRVDLRVAPLLRGNLRLASVTLVAPRLTLARGAQGRASWRARAGAASADGAGSGLPLGVDLRLETLRIRDGTLVYADRARGHRLRLTAIDGRIATDGGRGPFDARGTATWRGVPMGVRANLGRLAGDGAVPFGVTLRPELAARAAADTARPRVRLTGAVESRRPLALRGELEASGPDAGPLLARLDAPARTIRLMQERAYGVSARLRLANGALSVSDLDLRMGEVALSGDGEIRPGPPLALDADLAVQRLRLDRLVASVDGGRADPGAAGDDGRGGDRVDDATAGARAWSLPTAMTADVEISAPALVYRDQVIRQGQASLRLADGALRVREAGALLPGGSEVTLSGALTTPDAGPRFDGRVLAASDNLRAVFDWLEVSTGRVAPDRLRRLDLAADLAARPSRITLSDLDLAVDTLNARGGLVVALGGRPGLGVGLRIDRLDLDAYWPDRPRSTTGEDGDGAGGNGDTAGATGPRALLGRADANLDLRVGTLVAGGRQVQDTRLEGTLERGTLRLDALTAEGVAGGPLRLDGEIAGVAGARPRFDVNLSWQDVEPHAAAAWLAGVGGVPAGWPAMSVSGQVKGRPGDLRVNLALQALDGLLTARGALAAPRGDGARPVADLKLALQHDSLRRLLDGFTALPPLRREPGAVDLSARLRADAGGFRAAKLDGTIGRIPVSGRVAADLSKPVPMFDLNLETGALPLGMFALGRSGAGGTAGAGGGGAAGDWSAAPLGLRALRRVDGALTLRASALRLDGSAPLSDARVAATLDDGVLDVAEFAGRLGGGTLAARGTLDASATPRVSAAIGLDGVDAGAFGDLVPGLRLAGPLRLVGEFRAQGRSERKLVETFSGDGYVAGTLRLRPTAGESRLLDALFGTRLDRVANVARAADAVDRAFREHDGALAGRWRVADGVVRSDGIALKGRGMTATLRGSANLPDWRGNATLAIRRPGGTRTGAFLTAAMQGDLSAPDLRLAGSGLDIAGPEAPEGPDAPAAPRSPGDAGGDTAADGNRDAGGDDAAGGAAADDSGGADDAGGRSAEEVIRKLLEELPAAVE